MAEWFGSRSQGLCLMVVLSVGDSLMVERTSEGKNRSRFPSGMTTRIEADSLRE